MGRSLTDGFDLTISHKFVMLSFYHMKQSANKYKYDKVKTYLEKVKKFEVMLSTKENQQLQKENDPGTQCPPPHGVQG